MYKVKELYYINEASSCHQKHPTQNQGKSRWGEGEGKGHIETILDKSTLFK